MLFRLISLLTVCGVVALDCHAQSLKSDTNTKDSTIFDYNVEGLSRPKGLEINEEILTNYSINSKSTIDNSNGQAEIRATRRREIKLKAPLVNQNRLKMAIGFKYKVEDIFFENPEQQSFDFYRQIEDKNLKSLGTSLYLMRPFNEKRFLLIRASASLNGDYEITSHPATDYIKYSIAPMIGWKKNDNLSYGVGIAYSQNFGRISVFPLFSYNRTFNEHFGIETMLPVNASLRYSTIDQKNFIYMTSKIEGTTYNVNFPNGNKGYLNNTEFKYQIRYEREIYDFIWVGIESGLRTNLNFSLSETPVRRLSTVVNNNLNMAFFVGFSIFIVPPRKFVH